MPDQRLAGREVLPIPDRQGGGLVTYDAKDPDTSFAAMEAPPFYATDVGRPSIDPIVLGSS